MWRPVDLTRFCDLVCDIAAGLRAAGDDDHLGARKAKALGVLADLADSQSALDLQSVSGNKGKRSSNQSGKVKFYVHVDADDLDVAASAAGEGDDGSALAVGHVERLGAATVSKIREWAGHGKVVIQPVLDMRRGDAVDDHDPPDWMRELGILRDRHCVFPGCTRDARFCDIDHIESYDENGPPGKTHPDGLACLCRRPHRAKTAGRWRYSRTPQGDYLWHGPHRASYMVTSTGTFSLHRLS